MEYLFVDVETGGLDINKHDLLQVGLVAYIDNKIVDSYELSIKKEEYVVDSRAMRYNGLDLYEDIYKCGIESKEAVDKIIEFICKNFSEVPILVGHNPSIDKYMVDKLFKGQGMDMSNYISHRMIDTMSLIWGLHISGRLPKEACSSNGAFKYFGIEVENRHHALDDCLATVKLFNSLIDILKEQGESRVG